MSRVREGTCAEPGPYNYHCTEPIGHDWSCYDAGDDESWNDRSPEDWQTETPHVCQQHPAAPTDEMLTDKIGHAIRPYTALGHDLAVIVMRVIKPYLAAPSPPSVADDETAVERVARALGCTRHNHVVADLLSRGQTASINPPTYVSLLPETPICAHHAHMARAALAAMRPALPTPDTETGA